MIRRKGRFTIYEHFHALNPEKQQRILNAAYREFARNGYQKTSVGQIVESAGIAKGMLFYYFDSKLGLYEYLFTYAADFILSYFGTLEEKIKELDYIEQYRRITKIKLQAYMKNPYIFEFYTMIFFKPENIEVSAKAKSSYEEILMVRMQTLESLSSAGDTSSFRDDFDEQRIKNYISWFFEGYTQSLLAKLNGKNLADIELAPYWTEFDEILEDLKKLFYKNQEGLCYENAAN